MEFLVGCRVIDVISLEYDVRIECFDLRLCHLSKAVRYKNIIAAVSQKDRNALVVGALLKQIWEGVLLSLLTA